MSSKEEKNPSKTNREFGRIFCHHFSVADVEELVMYYFLRIDLPHL
jgi:hypothetical protein